VQAGLVASDVGGLLELCELAEGKVTQLGLTFNRLGREGAAQLCAGLNAVASCGPSQSLGRNSWLSCDSSGAVAACGPLQSPVQSHCWTRSIQALFLGSNGLQDEGARVVCRLIRESALPLLTKISLNDNGITDEGVREVVHIVGACSNIEVLGLSKNLVTSAGAAALSVALSENTRMVRLFLNNNPLLGIGAVQLAVALRTHPCLKVIITKASERIYHVLPLSPACSVLV
jgi:Leucine Rich repeat